MTTLPSAARPSLGALLVGSWAVLRAHPVVGAALGAAVVFSLASMLFGIGVLSAPWFICEIFALQLAVLTGRSAVRGVGWIRAGVEFSRPSYQLAPFVSVPVMTWADVQGTEVRHGPRFQKLRVGLRVTLR